MSVGWRAIVPLNILFVVVGSGLFLQGTAALAEPAATASTQSSDEAAYTRTIQERAGKIVDALGIDDPAQSTRVRDFIASHYRGLREIHDARDAKLKQSQQSPAADAGIAQAWSKAAHDEASLKTNDLHRQFVARLAANLKPAQVEKVKNGLTYNVVPITYKRYRQLLPDLSDDQKKEILAHLLEARELAMDGGSSDEKHAIFGKYKGRINNYLSAQGFDMKAAEKALAAKEKAVKPGNQ